MSPSPEQSMAALVKANSIRVARAAWKREVRGLMRGEAWMAIASAVAQRDPRVEAERLYTLLKLPRGHTFADSQIERLIHALNCLTADRKVRDLSDRQRQMLIAALEEKARSM